MSVSTRTWRHSALYTVSAATVAGNLAALKAAIDAEVIANPSTYFWGVADSSVPNGTLTLKRSANGTGGAGRIMVFGGSAPNTNAIDAQTSATTSLYGGFAATATSDAPEQAYTAGKPYTTGDWIPGGSILVTATIANSERVEYYETEDGIFVVFRLASMNASNSMAGSFFAGNLAVSVDGQTAYAISGGSAGALVTTNESSGTAGTGFFFGNGTEGTAANTRTNYQESAGNVRRCKRMTIIARVGEQEAWRDGASKRYFYPIYLRNSDQTRTIIKMRQMAMGITETHNQLINSATLTPACTKIAIRSDQVDCGPWLTNFLT